MSDGRRSAAARAAPFLVLGFLYLATSPYHQGLNNPNEMVRVYMSKAMVEDHTLAIDKVIGEWGGVDDKAIREGRLYSSKAPLQSLLGAPIYAAARPALDLLGIQKSKRALTTALRLFGSTFPGLAFSALLLAWARRRSAELGAPPALGTALGLALGLGTMLYPYALTFTGHELPAIGAGGSYLAVIGMARAIPQGDRRGYRLSALLAGFLAGATPFAEYPAALVALPALLAGLWITPGTRGKLEALVCYAAGGALPFGLGLWAHQALWGSPFATGYAFLENKSYVEVHGKGFFGVSLPKAEAFAGSLFSPGTGLFFFSPVLLVGLAALTRRCLLGEQLPLGSEDGLGALGLRGRPLPRALAVAGMAGFVLSVLFISGHQGWRGGWTLGPRYIISVAPLLGVWAVEALVVPRVRPFAAALGAVSILTTGFAAALYPHLSDVFTNPLWTFVLPSYLRGEHSYGLAWWLGLRGQAANLVHLLPLAGAMAYVAVAGLEPAKLRVRMLAVGASLAAMVGLIALVPERDPAAAERENQRLWGFWEPANPIKKPPAPPRPPGLLDHALERWRSVQVQAILPDGTRRACAYEGPAHCRYGDQAWQKLTLETFTIDGGPVPLLYLHPIAGETVRAAVPAHRLAQRAVLRFGLSDAAVESDNKSPVELWVGAPGQERRHLSVGNVRGLRALELPLPPAGTSTQAQEVVLEISAEKDGARVFGFDVEFYRE